MEKTYAAGHFVSLLCSHFTLACAAFQQLGNLFTPGNSVVASGLLLNDKIIFPFTSITLILHLRFTIPFRSQIAPYREVFPAKAAEPKFLFSL